MAREFGISRRTAGGWAGRNGCEWLSGLWVFLAVRKSGRSSVQRGKRSTVFRETRRKPNLRSRIWKRYPELSRRKALRESFFRIWKYMRRDHSRHFLVVG